MNEILEFRLVFPRFGVQLRKVQQLQNYPETTVTTQTLLATTQTTVTTQNTETAQTI